MATMQSLRLCELLTEVTRAAGDWFVILGYTSGSATRGCDGPVRGVSSPPATSPMSATPYRVNGLASRTWTVSGPRPRGEPVHPVRGGRHGRGRRRGADAADWAVASAGGAAAGVTKDNEPVARRASHFGKQFT